MPENKPHIRTVGEQFHDHGGNLEQLLEHMPDEEAFYKASDIFQQLCDPTRLRIVAAGSLRSLRPERRGCRRHEYFRRFPSSAHSAPDRSHC